MASYIRRRKFLATLLGGAAWPRAALGGMASRCHALGAQPFDAAVGGASWGPLTAPHDAQRGHCGGLRNVPVPMIVKQLDPSGSIPGIPAIARLI